MSWPFSLNGLVFAQAHVTKFRAHAGDTRTLAPQHAAMAFAFANGYAMGRVTLM